MAKLAPSVLGANFAYLEEDIRSADKVAVDMFHLDIMDGHFVPNISFGPGVVKTIDGITDSFLDVHLMLSEPEKYFDDFIKAGADSITYHIEVHPDPIAHARALREKGCQAGISLNPETPIDAVLPYLHEFDLLLVMSVHPGFGGQSFIESALGKVAAARGEIERAGLQTVIQVDGGVDGSNAARVVEAGADILVMGTAFFGAADRLAMAEKVKSL